MYAHTKQASRKIKHVRFKGLDHIDIDEEENRLKARGKLAKDAPMGAEITNAWKIDGNDSDSDNEV